MTPKRATSGTVGMVRDADRAPFTPVLAALPPAPTFADMTALSNHLLELRDPAPTYIQAVIRTYADKRVASRQSQLTAELAMLEDCLPQYATDIDLARRVYNLGPYSVPRSTKPAKPRGFLARLGSKHTIVSPPKDKPVASSSSPANGPRPALPSPSYRSAAPSYAPRLPPKNMSPAKQPMGAVKEASPRLDEYAPGDDARPSSPPPPYAALEQ